MKNAIETDPEDQGLWFYYRWLVAGRDEASIASAMPRLTRIGMIEEQTEWLKELLEGHTTCRDPGTVQWGSANTGHS